MNKKYSLNEDTFIEIVKNTPLVSIDLIITNNKDEVLLGVRKNKPALNTWFVPGGRISKNEKIEDAIIRISENEIGVQLHIEDTIFIGAFDHIYEDNFANDPDFGTHYVALAFLIPLDYSIDLKRMPKTQHNKVDYIHESIIVDNNSYNDIKIHKNTKDYFPISKFLNSTDSGLYRALMSHYLHYDQQLWSRTKILLAVEGAALVAGYKLAKSTLGFLIMIAAAFLVKYIHKLLTRDEENRDVNINVMDRLASTILKRPLYPRTVNLRRKSRNRKSSGHYVINLVFKTVFYLNILLAIIYLLYSKKSLYSQIIPETMKSIINFIK